jgi:hypothetical protein
VVDDVDAAMSEMARVLCPGGRLVVVSFRAEHFDRFHLNSYFPTLAGIDRARFPDPAALSAAIGEAGFHDVAERGLHQQVTLAPEAVLERVRGRYISTLHLLDEREYQDGLARLEHDAGANSRSLPTCSSITTVRASAATGGRAPCSGRGDHTPRALGNLRHRRWSGRGNGRNSAPVRSRQQGIEIQRGQSAAMPPRRLRRRRSRDGGRSGRLAQDALRDPAHRHHPPGSQ